MPHAEARQLALQASNILAVAIEADHAEAIAAVQAAIAEIATYRRDLKQGAQVAASVRRSELRDRLLAAQELIPAWEALDGTTTYVDRGRAYVNFASEREARRFCETVKATTGKVLTPALMSTPNQWGKCWHDELP